MIESNEKSLKIVSTTIFEKIKDIISKLLKNKKTEIKIENNKPKEQEQIQPKINPQEELIKKIETEEIKKEEQKDEELEKINANLTRYLEKIQKEMKKSEKEINNKTIPIKQQ